MSNVTRGLDNRKNITFLEERFEGHCPFNILHNILGLHLTKHAKCTAVPWENTGCEHGRHGRPVIPRQANGNFMPPLKGKVVPLALNLWRRAGEAELFDHCPNCEEADEEGIACLACGRQWWLDKGSWQLHTATVEGEVAACRRFVAENVEEEEEEEWEEGEEEEEAGEEEAEEYWEEGEEEEVGEEHYEEGDQEGEEEQEVQEEQEWEEDWDDDAVDPDLLQPSHQEDDGLTIEDADWSADESEPAQKRPRGGSSQQEATLAAAAASRAETLKVELDKALERVKELEQENKILSLKLQLVEALASKG